MGVLTINNDELIAQLETVAKRKGIEVAALVEELLEEYIQRQGSRRHDPIVGLFDSGQDDIVDRHEDILSEWAPD